MKRKVLVGILGIILLAGLMGCATGTKGKLVSAYELGGITLKTGYNVAKTACDSKQLPVDRCTQLKKIYNDARSAYLLAGDALAIAVETDDLVKRQAALQEYQNVINQATIKTTELINLLVQLGVIKQTK